MATAYVIPPDFSAKADLLTCGDDNDVSAKSPEREFSATAVTFQVLIRVSVSCVLGPGV